jgi:hypothetical protein
MIEHLVLDAKKLGLGVSPAIILFSDVDFKAGNTWGDKWRQFLIELGYRVDKFHLGRNPNTGNLIAIYHWFLVDGTAVNTAKTVSLTREYIYEQEEKEREARASEPGVPTRKRAIRDRLGRFSRGIR